VYRLRVKPWVFYLQFRITASSAQSVTAICQIMKIAQFVCSLLCVDCTKGNLFSSESRIINERGKEQEGRKHRTKDGSIDETKYV
jgi:hypothetical protein